MDKDQSEQELMSVVSYLYYYADLNQSDIADRLFLSRSTVSRLLKKARLSGVVELKINEPWRRDLELEDFIKSTFNVGRVRVLDNESIHNRMKIENHQTHTSVLGVLGQMTSYCISCTAQENYVLGLSWGRTISHVIDSITTSQNIPFTVVSIMGNQAWPSSNEENIELSQRFSKVYGGRYFPLNGPLYARSKEQHKEIMNEPSNAEALGYARKANIILTSVGTNESGEWLDAMGQERMNRLLDLGCVGRIGGHYYDINGIEIEGNFKELLIGLTLEEIRSAHKVICVAATETKATAVYGALRGCLINELHTTKALAEELVKIVENRRI